MARLPPLFNPLDLLDPKEARIKSFTMLLPMGFGFLGAFFLPGLQTRHRGARFVSLDRKILHLYEAEPGFLGHDLSTTSEERREKLMMSREHNMICPSCESGELHPRGPTLAHCDGCSRALSEDVLKPIQQIVALPGAIGTRACECSHPEMRPLPDGVFWCPACDSKVLPLEKDAHGRLDYHGG